MVAKRADRPATYADIEALPPNIVGEIVHGVLYANPRPASPHARAATKLGSRLGPPFDDGHDGPGGWVILFEPELHLLEDVVVPDWAGWRRERMPEMPEAAFFTLAPDWLCEVISPSTAKLDRGAKLQVYAREQVRWVWFIDPLQRTLEILCLDDGKYRIDAFHQDDAKVRAEPFDAIEIELGALWSR